MNRRVAIIDDDASMCAMLEQDLTRRGFQVSAFTDPQAALNHLRERDCDTVLTDLNLPKIDGLELCRRVTASRPDVPVVVMTAFGSLETAIGAIRAGAYDFVTKPVDLDILAIALDRAVSHRDLKDKIRILEGTLEANAGFDELIGNSEPMKRLAQRIRRLADSEASVLITGESGTGKELLARVLHRYSQRGKQPFIAVNCAALPDQLLESELFGVCKGAFTDAREDRRGLILEAQGGTLLLDEVVEIPMSLQPKLLRVLEERTVRPLGGTQETNFDVRLVAATNRDLEEAVANGQFREDLYYRLAVVPIHVPPLRARGTDVILLAQHFLTKLAKRTDLEIRGFSDVVVRKLLDYDWPGNVRELRNVIERAVALTNHDTIVMEDLPPKIIDHQRSHVMLDTGDPADLLPLHEVESRYIAHVVAAVDGNRSQAARILEIDRKTLIRKLRRDDENGALKE